jgi:hypothetical protein
MIDANLQYVLGEEHKAFRILRWRACRALAWFFVVTFAILMIVGIVIAWEPVPLGDYWVAALELAADVKSGHVSAWFARWAEHRPVLPNVLFWLDVNLFGGHSLLLVLGGLTFAAFAWLLLFCIALPERTKPGDHRFYIAATLPLLAFSWVQLPNLFSGTGTATQFLVIFFPLATFFAVAKSKESTLSFFVAILSGVASAGTLANGLVALPIATALALALDIGRWRVALLAVISAVSMGRLFHLHRFHRLGLPKIFRF